MVDFRLTWKWIPRRIFFGQKSHLSSLATCHQYMLISGDFWSGITEMTSLCVSVFLSVCQFARSFSLVQMTRYRATDTANIENGHPLKAWYIITCRTRDRSMGSLTIPDLWIFREVLPGADEDLGGLGEMDDFAGSFMASRIHLLGWQLYPPAQPKSHRFHASKMWITCAPKCPATSRQMAWTLNLLRSQHQQRMWTLVIAATRSLWILVLNSACLRSVESQLKHPKSREPKALESCW